MTPALATAPISTATPTISGSVDGSAAATEVAARTPTVAETTTLVAWLQPLGRALQELVDLPPDWDSYGAVAPSRVALQFAWQLASELVERGVPTPQVFPTRSGGIQLEWNLEHAGLEWEVDANLDTGVFIFDDHRTGERLDGELPGDIQGLAESIARIRSG